MTGRPCGVIPPLLEAETPREALVLLQGRVLDIWEWLTLCYIL